MITVDGVRYKEWTPTNEEKEFHPLVRAQSKEIFGKNSIYFDVKTTIRSSSGIGSIPDAYVIDLEEPYKWYVVENELATHPIYDHIVKQLTKFINGLDNQSSRTQILELLYQQVMSDNSLRELILTKTKSSEVHHFLTKLISKQPTLVVIIDQLTPDIEDVCQALKYVPEIVEFRTFKSEVNPEIFVHQFEPLNSNDEYVSSKEVLTNVVSKREKREEPEHRQSWEKRIAWVNDETRVLVNNLTQNIVNDLDSVIHKPMYRWYAFYKGKEGSRNRFVTLLINKKSVTVCIRANPNSFSDPNKWAGDKIYTPWFFNYGQERRFQITSQDQIEYAMNLIRQSYEATNET